jgi:uncharacterized membrane-anchored protein
MSQGSVGGLWWRVMIVVAVVVVVGGSGGYGGDGSVVYQIESEWILMS